MHQVLAEALSRSTPLILLRPLSVKTSCSSLEVLLGVLAVLLPVVSFLLLGEQRPPMKQAGFSTLVGDRAILFGT